MKRKHISLFTAFGLVASLLVFPTAAAAEEPERMSGEPEPILLEKEVPELEPSAGIFPEPEPGEVQPFPAGGLSLRAESLGGMALLSAEEAAGEDAVLVESSQNGQVTARIYYTLAADQTASAVYAEEAAGMVVIPGTFTVDETEYTVTSVGPQAFAGLTGLTQVWLPETVESLGYAAFVDCDHLKAVGTYTQSGGSDPYALPSRIDRISDRAFRGCTRLSCVRIPAAVTSIGGWAFAYCYSLGQNYTDSAGVTYGVYFEEGSRLRRIEQGAFYHCMVLENITLPEGLREIGPDAFAYCGGATSGGDLLGLRTLTLPETVEAVGDNAFAYCLNLRELTIPAGVESLGQKAFYSCSALETLRFTGDGLTSMGGSAFFWCTRLKTITTGDRSGLPDTLKTIPRWAFYRCLSLGEMDLSHMSALREIEPYAFNESGVTSVKFPQTLLEIGALAFQGCEKLTDIDWNRPADDRELLTVGEMAFAQTGVVHVTLPQLYDRTGPQMFYDCDQLRSVTLLEPARFIPQGAFRDCDSLCQVTFCPNLLDIGYMAFYSCRKLTAANFTEAVALRSIGEVAFCRTGFTTVTLPAGILFIGDNAFGINRSMTAFAIDGEATAGGYFVEDGVLYQYDQASGLTLVKYPAGRSASGFTVADSVTRIAPYGFSHSEQLETVVFPAGLLAIGDYAFSHCIRLKTAGLPQNVTLGDDVFGGCSLLTDIRIPEGTVTISSHSFPSYAQITSITLPASAETLEDLNPFSLLTNLEEFRVAAGSRSFKAVDGVLFSADMTTLLAYPIAKAGKEYVIPEGVTTVNAWAFRGAVNLEHIVFPASVETVGPSACYDLPNLSRVDIYRENITMDTNPNLPGYHLFLGNCAQDVEVFLTGDPYDPANGKERDQKIYKFYYNCRTSGDSTVNMNNIHVDYFKAPAQPGDRFVENGVIYTLSASRTVTVEDNTHYQGSSLAIPARVTHRGVEYTVAAVASGAFRGLSGLNVTLAGTSVGVADDAFEPDITLRKSGDIATFEAVETSLAYGDTLTLLVPSGVSEGSRVTIADTGLSATVTGGVALFPVSKAMVDTLGFGEKTVTVQSGSASADLTFTLSPRTYTAADLPGQSNLNGALLIEKTYDGTGLLDYTSAQPLRDFLIPGDDVALHITGSTDVNISNTIKPLSNGAAELTGEDVRYYSLSSDVKSNIKVRVVYGQLYLKEVNGVLQQPTFTRVWSPEDGMRVKDCALGGGVFVAYLPVVENGAVTGYETVEVNGTITYDEENHYPGLASFEDIGVQMNETYRWVFTPENNGANQSRLANYRFCGTVKLWDPSLTKGPDTLTGKTGENPELPGYVTLSLQKAPALPGNEAKTPAASAPTQSTKPGSGSPGSSSGTGSGGSSSSSSGSSRPGGSSPSVSAAAPAPAPSGQPQPAEPATVAAARIFTDVSAGSSHAAAIQYVYDKGLMNGLTATAFGPDAPTSRAMVVTLLYRLEEEPNTAAAAFSDVPARAYYAAPVAWAAANGVVLGNQDGTFRPNEGVTWEQLAAILYRYAGVKGYDRTSRASIDTSRISSFAREPMAWLWAEGLLDNVQYQNPKASVTRAEIAEILMAFCEQTAKS